MSGKEQQRVSLIRILLKKSDIILADEPTGNLDHDNKEIVLKALEAMNAQGATVIVVTHDEEAAHRCHRIISL